jgi:hypothetical protein
MNKPFLTVVCVALIAVGCANPTQDRLTDKGLVLVSIGGGEARTLMPSPSVYRFTFTSPGKRDVAFTSSGANVRVELEAGVWYLTVVEFDESQEKVAEGGGGGRYR